MLMAADVLMNIGEEEEEEEEEAEPEEEEPVASVRFSSSLPDPIASSWLSIVGAFKKKT